jgi:Ca2+-binding EF-hand superfamily protein
LAAHAQGNRAPSKLRFFGDVIDAAFTAPASVAVALTLCQVRSGHHPPRGSSDLRGSRGLIVIPIRELGFCARAVVGLGLVIVLGSVDPLFAQDQPNMPPAPAPRPPVGSLAVPPIVPPTEYLLRYLSRNSTLQMYLNSLGREFRLVDADSDGEISESDAALHLEFARANFRSMLISSIMRADLNGDGMVTEDELLRLLRYSQRLRVLPPAPGSGPAEAEARKLMAADTDHDGSISLEEAAAWATSQVGMMPAEQWTSRVEQFLKFAPEGKTAVTLKDVELAAEAFFAAVDTNGDGTVSADELNAYRTQYFKDKGAGLPPGVLTSPVQQPADLQRQAGEMRAQREAALARQRAEARRKADEQRAQKEAELRAACAIPKASDAAKVVLISSYGPEALSSVTIGSQDVAVRTGTIDVETGKEPLYLVVVSFEPAIWRFRGAAGRIEQLVLTTGRPERIGELPQDKPVVGAIGIPADRIAFLPPGKCIKHFIDTPSGDAATATAIVQRELGKDVATSAGRNSFSEVAIPSGRMHSLRGRDADKMLVIKQSAGTLKILGSSRNIVVEAGSVGPSTNLPRFTPGGVVAIDAGGVVAPLPVEKYEVLPEEAGLMQLLREGKIAQNRSGEYLIKKKIRFPADLYGAHLVRFLLMRGVPKPDGDPGHSTVISQETGEN